MIEQSGDYDNAGQLPCILNKYRTQALLDRAHEAYLKNERVRVTVDPATEKITSITPINPGKHSKLVKTGSYQKKSHYAKPLFQRRHYEAVAEVINKLDDNAVLYDMMLGLSRMFAGDNNNFAPGKFYEACNTLSPPVEPVQLEEPTVKVNHLEPINWGELRAVRRRDE